MTNRPTETAQHLRQHAEELFRAGESSLPELTSPEATKELLHELRVHQIQLEMQNDELRRTEANLDVSQARYFGLYDLAPVGYLTIDESGLIKEANLAAATMLGVDRNMLIKHSVNRIIFTDDQDMYYLRQKQSLDSSAQNIDEIRLVRGDGSPFWVHLQLTAMQNGENWITFTDITERKLAEEACEAQRMFAHFTLDGLTANICVINARGLIVNTNNAWNSFAVDNKAAEGTYGEGINYLEVCRAVSGRDKADVESTVAGINAVLEGSLPDFIMEYPCHSPDIKRWFIVRANRFSVAGETYAVISHENITSVKLAEMNLEAANKMLKTILDTVPVRIFWKDAELRFLGCNRAFVADAGVGCPEDLIGKDDFQMVWKDQAELYQADDRRVMASGISQLAYEEAHTAADGKLICVRTSKVPLCNEADTIVGVLGIYEDISGQKRTENELHEKQQRLTTLLHETKTGTWEWNIQTGETVFNAQWAEAIGYTLNEISPVSIETWIQYCHPDDLQISGELLEKHFRGESEYYEFEARMKHKDGHWIWVLDRGRVVSWSDDGKPLWMFGTHHDITEGKNLKEQLLQSQKMESIGQLAGGLAHDFNNLLSIINGYCGLLQMKVAQDGQLSEYTTKILSASGRAGELTHSLMAFSRTQVMKLQHHNLNVIVSKVGDFVQRIIGDNITFKVDIKDASLFVHVDGGQIEQVLINLANNARDAMPEGGTFTFSTDLLQMNDTFLCVNGIGPPGRYAVITAADTGTGMDEATRKKIFEPFFTTKEVGQGTGLGLAMVIGIVSQHNGYVTVSSEQGHGTSFTIYLPLSPPAIEAPVENMDTALEKYSGTETLMVVEDDADVREFLQQYLSMSGYKVLTAADGEDALRTFKADADGIGLVITDLIMPRMNGKQMFDEIRRIRPDMKALFSSGYSAKIIEQQGDLGANAEFMTKPLQPALLVKMVREMLDRPLK